MHAIGGHRAATGGLRAMLPRNERMSQFPKDYAPLTKAEKPTFQVWHSKAGPPSRFPEDYVHVADVRADGLKQAVALTTDKGNSLEGKDIPWERNRGVQAVAPINRSTDKGDVIVAPSGQP